MSLQKVSKVLEEFSKDSFWRGCCLNDCALLAGLKLAPAKIVRTALEGRGTLTL